MATKSSAATSTLRVAKAKKKRPGVHAKSKRDVNRKGKHWAKPYRGQGR